MSRGGVDPQPSRGAVRGGEDPQPGQADVHGPKDPQLGQAAIRGPRDPQLSQAAIRGAAVLLGAAATAWAAAPLIHKGLANFTLFIAICGVIAGALRLALAGVPLPENSFLLPTPLRAWIRFVEILRLLPWEEGAVIAIVWLEVQHPARPWHTAWLGAMLVAYLLAVHLAESGASAAALRPQVRVLAIGAGLLAIGAAAGMLPAPGPGAASALLRLVAAIALIAAAGLVLPSML
jgi:hypothetical protein